MKNKFRAVIFEGVIHDNYMVNRKKEVVSIFGNVLTVNKGKVTLKIDGKRRSIKIEDIVKETFSREDDNLHYDFSTKNTSFLEVHKVLESEGVINNKFFLALYNEELVGLNPHFAAHKKEVRLAILEECKKNPWYFLREVVRYEDVNGVKHPFMLNQANLANTFLAFNNISSYTVTPRTTFRTGSAAALMAWFKLFGDASEMSMNDISIDNANAIKKSVDVVIQALPKYIRDYDSNRSFKINTLESPLNATQASTTARSNIAPIQLFDNFEFIKHNAYLVLEGCANFLKLNEAANDNDTPSFRMLLSTVGREDRVEEKFIDAIINESVYWNNAMYDEEDYIVSHLHKVSPIAMVYIEFSAEDIVEDADKYYTRQEMLLKGSDEDTISREVYLRRPETSISPSEQAEHEEEEYIQSVHEWYEGTEAASKAIKIFETLDITVFDNGVPQIVMRDLEADGVTDISTLDPSMIRAYIIRRIATVLSVGMNTDIETVYENEYDTYFATFGISSPELITELFSVNEVAKKLYMGILFASLPLLSIDPEVSFKLRDAGPFSAKSFHILTNLINQPSAE